MSTNAKTMRDLFVSDVTRDIPPVVYFHEQSPEKLRDEVSEYIITGGWKKDHPNYKRVPDGIPIPVFLARIDRGRSLGWADDHRMKFRWL